MFLLVPAYPGSPGQKAVKRLCVCVCLYLMMLVRRHVAIMLPPSDASSENRSAAGRVSLSSHVDLTERRMDDDSASLDAVVSADSKELVTYVIAFTLQAHFTRKDDY